MAETLGEIRQLARDLSSKQSTDEISNDTIDGYINNWYQNKLPFEVGIKLNNTWRLQTIPDQEWYTVSTAYQALTGYVAIEDEDLEFFIDPQGFKDNWPDAWKYEPSVETGDGSTTSFSGTLTASANVLPLSVVFGDDTETFYDDGSGVLTGSAGGSGTINYTTYAYTLVFNTAPSDGTDVSAHYATYSASQPQAVLYYEGELAFRPIPDGTYDVVVEYEKRPTALSSDSDEPTKKYWGDLIAYGTAIDTLERNNDRNTAAELKEEYKRILDVCISYEYKSLRTQTPRPAW